MFKTLAFILLWITVAVFCLAVGFTLLEGISAYLLPLVFPNLKKRLFEDVAVPPVLLVAAIAGFWVASRLLRVKSVQFRSVANDITKQIAYFRSEPTAVRLFYIIFIGIPDGLCVLMILLGAGNTKSSDPSGMGRSLNLVAAVFIFPVLLNSAIMFFSLLATPLIRRLSAGPWAKCHVRNSLVIPLIAILLIWLAAGIGVYLSSWARLLRS